MFMSRQASGVGWKPSLARLSVEFVFSPGKEWRKVSEMGVWCYYFFRGAGKERLSPGVGWVGGQ